MYTHKKMKEEQIILKGLQQGSEQAYKDLFTAYFSDLVLYANHFIKNQAATEDIYISKNGKIIAKITSPYKNKLDIVKELYGSIPNTVTLEDAQKERLKNL